MSDEYTVDFSPPSPQANNNICIHKIYIKIGDPQGIHMEFQYNTTNKV